DGILWIGTQAGLHRYEKGQGSFQRYLPDAENPHSLNNETVWKIAGGEQDIIYIATFGGGLNKFDKRTGRFTHYTNDPNRTSSIGDNRILSIFPDADLHGGGLWLGTMTSGVQVHFPHRRKFIHYRHNPDDPNSLSNDAVYALAEDYHGYVWIGTSNGLNRFDPRSKKFLRYYQDASKPPGLLDNRVTSIYAGDSGTLWIGTFAGVSKFDSESNRFLDRNTYQALASLGGTTIWCFHRDRSGSLWIGTRTGLYRYVKNNDRLTLFEHDPGDPQSLTNNDVRCIYEDQTGRLWIGTLGGLDILDRNENHFYHLTYFPNDPQGLSDRIIWTVREDSKGNLWVGTKGGLNRLVEVPEVKQDTIRAQFTPFTEEEGLPNNSVYAILEDDHGFLWLSTNRGISKFDPLNTTFENFDMNDGLQSSEFNYGAHLKSERGGLYFGGVNGFNVFHPDSIPKNTHRPPVVITEFKIFDQPVEFNHSITSANRLELSHNENFFSFSFAALDYADPSKNQYQYQLVGFNREWIDAGHRRYASYTNVPPGHYVFRVIGANNDGVWNREGTSVNIFISPPYWQTWWFRILGLLAVGALLYAFYRMRVHQLIEVERTRTRIARDLHDELSATLSSISFFSDAIRSTDLPKLSKENRRYLNLINESAAEARESMGDIIWAVNPENDRWDQFLAGLRRYASDLLSSKNILYQFELPEELPHKTIEMEKQRDVWLIFKEIITNVVKHSECSKVSIVLANSRNSLQVRINDDGKGFDPSCQDSGNGINNIRERAKMLNAECRLETSPGHGTRWELSFKL
ncbi:MAG: hypothetical protein GWN30_16420, partial [Gammaproteobacteria bacterium]|nr:hypothetical protein [Gammaproteobacteria bacterium]NIW96999.1 hypothetical protein [Phycisphaerae bacterium]